MRKREQRQLAREMARSVMKSVMDRSKDWPANWDGHEIRAVLADAFDANNWGQCKRDSKDARRREYENDRDTLNI